MVVLVEYLISPVSAHTASTVLFAFMAYLISSASTYRDTHTYKHAHIKRCLRGLWQYFIYNRNAQAHIYSPEAMAVFEIHLKRTKQEVF